MSDPGAKPDPDRYARMAVPFESSTAANDAVAAFYKDVEDARERHKITDVLVLVEISHLVSSGATVQGSSSVSFGAWHNRLTMLARAYGAERERFEKAIAELIQLGRQSERDR